MSTEIVPADRPGAWLVRIDGMDQSYVDLACPRRLEFDYVRWIGDVLDLAAPEGEPLRVVHIGGAGLTLPRYVVATRPRSSQIVLEPDAGVVEEVRRVLPVPPRSGIRIRPLDGRTGLSGIAEGSTDVVVLDAFSRGRPPAELLTLEAWAEIARILRPGGLLAANLTDRAPFPQARRAIAGIRATFPDIALAAEQATLRGRRSGNLVVVAGASVPAQALTRRVTTGAAPYRLLTAAAVSDSFGGGTPFRDPRGAATEAAT